MAKLLKTNVAEEGLTKLIQRLGRDCTPTQFVREFVMNSIEAIQRTGQTGSVLVDANWDYFEDNAVHKLCFVDNGIGMTLEEMRLHLNNLSSSGVDENVFENYGMGAKIAALTRNERGIMYDSWREGVGHRIIIEYNDHEKIFGIRPTQHADGSSSWGIELNDSEKPKLINQHGTQVTLFGMDWEQDTMLPPTGVKGGRENWLHQYINTRFFAIPENISLQIRTGYYRPKENARHNYLRAAIGQNKTLDKNCKHRGVVKLSDAKAHWWILKSDSTGHGRDFLNGHTGCVNQGELIDIADGRSNRAPAFGIIFGKEDVVLYI